MDDILNCDGADEIWSPEVEEAFLEALILFPSLSRSKFKNQDGKLYNRNFLISSYIKKKTRKIRTPKQIASHIQVWKKKQLKSESIQVRFE
uniref:TEA domain-containing protein n=1 Tax=Acrobeloides nanus TaxID=290746 RepID=A0A914DFU8_9BILA